MDVSVDSSSGDAMEKVPEDTRQADVFGPTSALRVQKVAHSRHCLLAPCRVQTPPQKTRMQWTRELVSREPAGIR